MGMGIMGMGMNSGMPMGMGMMNQQPQQQSMNASISFIQFQQQPQQQLGNNFMGQQQGGMNSGMEGMEEIDLEIKITVKTINFHVSNTNICINGCTALWNMIANGKAH